MRPDLRHGPAPASPTRLTPGPYSALRLDRARALTVAVDREVETSIAGLKGLATSDDLSVALVAPRAVRRSISSTPRAGCPR
jgi:hypothetical protein